MPRRPADPLLQRALEGLEGARTETDLTCALYPRLVLRTRELLAELRALGYCRLNANGTRFELTPEGRQRLGRP